MIRPVHLALLAAMIASPAIAAPRSVPTTQADALVGGHVIVSPGHEIDGATIIVRDGVIEAVGLNVPVPPDARRWDMAGFVLYPHKQRVCGDFAAIEISEPQP